MAGRTGRSGRPAKSNADKALAGNPGKRARKPAATPETSPPSAVQSSLLDPPSWLPEAAQDEWRRCAPELYRTKLLKPLNEMAFAIYCMNAAIVQSCAERLKQLEDVTYKSTSRHGELRRISPDFKAMREAQKDMLAFMKEYGMTPVSHYALGRQLAETPPTQPTLPGTDTGEKPRGPIGGIHKFKEGAPPPKEKQH